MDDKTNKNSLSRSDEQHTLTFGMFNYILMIVGVVLLALGYILLSGGGSDDPNVFNADMFDTRRLYVAPILIVLGFVVEIVAIMVRENPFKKK